MGFYLEASLIAFNILAGFWAATIIVDMFSPTFKESESEEGKVKVLLVKFRNQDRGRRAV